MQCAELVRREVMGAELLNPQERVRRLCVRTRADATHFSPGRAAEKTFCAPPRL